MSDIDWYACGRGHKIAANSQSHDVPIDLSGHICPACLGEVLDHGMVIDNRLLAPMQEAPGAAKEQR